MIRDTNIKIDRDICIACGICVDRCVMDNLRLSIAPCRQGCPLHINCQGVTKLIAKGKEAQAADMLKNNLPFIEILGRLCHAPCEKACARKKVDQPIHIRAMHRTIAKHTSNYNYDSFQPTADKQTGKKVVLCGTGPAAMMAAWRLGLSGHQGVMLEPENEAGGALRDYNSMSAINAKAIGKLVNAITSIGIDLETDVEPPFFKELFNSYDAVILTYKDERELSWILDHNSIDKKSFQIDPQTLQVIGQEKMFACRDLDGSKIRLVNALAAGKTASESVHRFLSGVPLMWERDFWESKGNVKEYTAPIAGAKHVQDKNRLSKKQENNPAVKFDTREAIVYEAQRCLGCGRPFDANQTCWYCLPCELDCPTNAIEVRIPYMLR